MSVNPALGENSPQGSPHDPPLFQNELSSRSRPETDSSQMMYGSSPRRRTRWWHVGITWARSCLCYMWQQLWHPEVYYGLPYWYFLSINAYHIAPRFMGGTIPFISELPSRLDLSQCASRVSQQQAPFFSDKTYYQQFDRQMWSGNPLSEDATFCGAGFEGNADAYGIGIRTGLYLQWLSSLIANQSSPAVRVVISQTYLASSLAITVAILVMTFRSQCTMSVEIVIMHTLFFGGHFVVFTWPNIRTAAARPQWMVLTWTRAIDMLSYCLLLFHAAWFWAYAYDRFFILMPCGTTLPFNTTTSGPPPLLDTLFALVMAEVGVATLILSRSFLALNSKGLRRSILESRLYQGVFPRRVYPGIADEKNQMSEVDAENARETLTSRLVGQVRDIVRLGLFQDDVTLPGGQSIFHRVLTGLISCSVLVYCVTTTELIIADNEISGVNSIDMTGQYMAFLIGAGGFLTVCYSLLKQTMVGDRRVTAPLLPP